MVLSAAMENTPGRQPWRLKTKKRTLLIRGSSDGLLDDRRRLSSLLQDYRRIRQPGDEDGRRAEGFLRGRKSVFLSKLCRLASLGFLMLIMLDVLNWDLARRSQDESETTA
jgi:hypothetical protein